MAAPSGPPQGARIGDLARKSGLSRQALHNYVLLGLLEPSGRTPGGHRLFGEEAARRLELIARLCRSGYTLQAIRETFLRDRALPGGTKGAEA